MNISTLFQNQLLATKFYIPIAPGPMITRPRLNALLDKSLKRPLTLVSAPAGFGKTTLLSTWAQSLPARHSLVAWISLDEEDNDPRLFWSYILAALEAQQPRRFTSLLEALQSPQALSLKSLLAALINLLAESTQHFVLILDDYQVITEEQVHTTLAYLLEHLPAQLHIILATRADPPLPLTLLRARHQVLEVHTEQLRCTVEETRAFFHEVIGTQLPDETIQAVTTRTEGWLVGLQLLALSLPKRADPLILLQEASGNQRYILDYLTEVVLRRQSQEVQMFLLSTSILERLTASLCDAVTQQTGSQEMLRQLEQANIFLVSLDTKREWYRYHGLFAEALYYQLKQTHADLVPLLHARASHWYAEHAQTTEAILHALKGHEWQWTADLIERKSLALNALSWGVSQYQLFQLRDWLKQIPAEVVSSRPSLSLARIWMLLFITPQNILETWLNAIEATLTEALTQNSQEQSVPARPVLQAWQEQANMLGEAIAYRALLQSHSQDGEAALALCQRAQSLLSADNFGARTHIAASIIIASYASSINDATAASQIGLQASSLNQAAGNTDQAISIMGVTAMHMIGTGRLHETAQLTQQAILLGRKPEGVILPGIGWPMIWQAEVLREWNELDAALSCIEEAIKLLAQLEWTLSLAYLLHGYAILLHISLSRRNYDAASSALQEVERINMNMNQPIYLYSCSHFTTVDQVRLWLARGDLDQATQWAKELDLKERQGTPFAREREEVARARISLATGQPALALEQLSPVLARATTGQRWGHVIEIRLLQALAYQMQQEETQALSALSEGICLAEPESYIRSFVDEGATMETLLYRLRKRDRNNGPTPYLDTLLAAFRQERMASVQAEEQAQVQALPEPLSQRELEVLQLLARGASNQEITQELVIAYDTVKRHVSNIFSKLGVNNRIQAVRQARELGLLEHHL